MDIDLRRSGSHSDLEHFVEDLTAIMTACLSAFRNLLVLSLRGPAFDHREVSRKVRSGMRLLAGDLLRYAPVKLQDLSLALASTEDYSTVLRRAITSGDTPLRIPLHTAMAGIKHLDLTIYATAPRTGTSSASTGHIQIGASSGTRSAEDPVNGASQYEPSNHAYAAMFFHFAQLPAQLESLKLSCSDMLNMDHLDIQSLSHLQSLDLKCVKISSTRLLDIITRCATSLRCFILETVELKSGTWNTVFVELGKLDNLLVLHVIEGCGYASDGISAQWSPRSRRRHRPNPQDLDAVKQLSSGYWLDGPALGDLQEKVRERRARLGLQHILCR